MTHADPNLPPVEHRSKGKLSVHWIEAILAFNDYSCTVRPPTRSRQWQAHITPVPPKRGRPSFSARGDTEGSAIQHAYSDYQRWRHGSRGGAT